MASDKYWKMLDTDCPEYVEELVNLVSWSENCDFPTPFNLFQDMIGYSEEQYGENYCRRVPRLGFKELSLLGKALNEFSHRPQDVEDWMHELVTEWMK
jgi:hypothetical protein